MRTSLILAVLIFGMCCEAVNAEAQEQRLANDEHLSAYSKSGGWAYWYDSKRGADPNGKEVMVRRCNSY